MHNGSLSPVYNVRGINNVPKKSSTSGSSDYYNYESYDKISVDYDTQIINEGRLENSAGVCRINEVLSSG
jgi:hypothetical protein